MISLTVASIDIFVVMNPHDSLRGSRRDYGFPVITKDIARGLKQA